MELTNKSWSFSTFDVSAFDISNLDYISRLSATHSTILMGVTKEQQPTGGANLFIVGSNGDGGGGGGGGGQE